MNESVVTQRMIKHVAADLMARLCSDLVVLGKLMPGSFVGPMKCLQPAAGFLAECREAGGAQISFCVVNPLCWNPLTKIAGMV